MRGLKNSASGSFHQESILQPPLEKGNDLFFSLKQIVIARQLAVIMVKHTALLIPFQRGKQALLSVFRHVFGKGSDSWFCQHGSIAGKISACPAALQSLCAAAPIISAGFSVPAAALPAPGAGFVFPADTACQPAERDKIGRAHV